MFYSKQAPALLLLTLLAGQRHSSCGVVAAVEDIEYLQEPELLWQTQTDVILDGNGVFTSPNDKVTVITQANGNLNAYDTLTGASLWTFTPPNNNGLATSCQGGAIFSTDGSEDFVVYSVVDDPNGITPFTRVISLSLDGNVNWISTPLEGTAAGSPLASFDGRHIFLTHNSNAMSVGHFSVLDTLDAQADAPVFPLYSEFNTTNPFSPPGIFHKPGEGYYDGGQGNTNDVVVWSHAPNPLDARVGLGASFVFQFPIDYAAPSQASARQADQDQSSSRRLYWMILGDNIKDWQAVSAPVLTNMGRSLYWSVTRSQFRAWVGQAGSNIGRFNRGKTSSPTFSRGSPRYAPCPNTPALSSSTTQPMVFAGTASNEFVKMNYLMDDDTALIRNTTTMVRARAIVSPDNRFVYFTEFSGILHQASTDDLVDTWSVRDFAALDGEFSLTSDGSVIIVGDVTGKVTAYRVAFRPTPSPTLSPTSQPTSSQPTSSLGFRPTVDGPIPVPGQTSSKPTKSPIFQSTPTLDLSQPTLTVEVSAGVEARWYLAGIAAVAACALLI